MRETSRIKRGGRSKNGPSPGKNFATTSDKCDLFCFAAGQHLLIKETQDIVTANAAECTHIKKSAAHARAALGNGNRAAHRSATDIGLGIDAQESSQLFFCPFAAGQRMEAIAEHQNR